MAKVFNFKECSINGDLRAHMKEEYSMIIPEYLIENIYQTIFQSCALMVKYHANKENRKTGFAFKDHQGEFVFGTILTFTPPEDEESEDGGNWNLDMTFNKEDMEGCDNNLDNYDSVFSTISNTQMYSQFRGHCTSNRDLSIIISEFINEIKHFLDVNSNETNEDVELEMPDVFVATVGFEQGKKVYTLTPGAAIKQLIKNDDAAERKVVPISEKDKENVELASAAFRTVISEAFGMPVYNPEYGYFGVNRYSMNNVNMYGNYMYGGNMYYPIQPVVPTGYYSPISIIQ